MLLLTSSAMLYTGTTGQKPGWFHLRCDEAIGDYYRWLYSRAGRTWYSCLNSVHITVISGEKDARIVQPEELTPWVGVGMQFAYEPLVMTNGRAFWVTVQSPDIQDMRRSLGLPAHPHLHMTLGNIKGNRPKI